MAYVLYRHEKNLGHVSPQNRFTLKEFETTTREIGLIIFLTGMIGKQLQVNLGIRKYSLCNRGSIFQLLPHVNSDV